MQALGFRALLGFGVYFGSGVDNWVTWEIPIGIFVQVSV